ncbi:Crp/Fnr family transcriptional regulator [Myroides sp. LJL119]
MEIQKILYPYFPNASKEQLEVIAKYFELQKIKKNDFFSQSNKYCNTLGIVQQGILRVFADYQSRQITQWLCTANSFVTDFKSFFFNQPCFYNIQAFNEVVLLCITKKNYHLLKQELPIWQEFESEFITKCFATMENRVFSHLALSASQRYQAYFKEYKSLFNQVPLHYIASILAMTPETLSRIRANQD